VNRGGGGSVAGDRDEGPERRDAALHVVTLVAWDFLWQAHEWGQVVLRGQGERLAAILVQDGCWVDRCEGGRSGPAVGARNQLVRRPGGHRRKRQTDHIHQPTVPATRRSLSKSARSSPTRLATRPGRAHSCSLRAFAEAPFPPAPKLSPAWRTNPSSPQPASSASVIVRLDLAWYTRSSASCLGSRC